MYFFRFWSLLLEDQLVLLPNKLPGSALDWLSRVKHPSALNVLGGEKRRTRKRTDKGFSLSKKCYFLKSPTFPRTWLGPESSTPVNNPVCVIDKAVTDRQRLFNFGRSHAVLTPAPSREASDSRRRDRKLTGRARDLTRIDREQAVGRVRIRPHPLPGSREEHFDNFADAFFNEKKKKRKQSKGNESLSCLWGSLRETTKIRAGKKQSQFRWSDSVKPVESANDRLRRRLFVHEHRQCKIRI